MSLLSDTRAREREPRARIESWLRDGKPRRRINAPQHWLVCALSLQSMRSSALRTRVEIRVMSTRRASIARVPLGRVRKGYGGG